MMLPMGEQLGSIVSRVRRLRGLSQEELGEAIGRTGKSEAVTGRTIRGWESGQHQVPQKKLPALCEALGIRVQNSDAGWTVEIVDSDMVVGEVSFTVTAPWGTVTTSWSAETLRGMDSDEVKQRVIRASQAAIAAVQKEIMSDMSHPEG